MNQVLIRPLITEKMTNISADSGKYGFLVSTKANKIQIKQEIEKMFEVNVTSVRTVRVKGKNKIRMTRRGLMRGRTPLKKKAYVTLKEGQTIELVSGVGSEE